MFTGLSINEQQGTNSQNNLILIQPEFLKISETIDEMNGSVIHREGSVIHREKLTRHTASRFLRRQPQTVYPSREKTFCDINIGPMPKSNSALGERSPVSGLLSIVYLIRFYDSELG